MRTLTALAAAVAIACAPASAADFAFAEPTDVRQILIAIAVAGRVNVIIGPGVEGLTTYVARDKDPDAALVEAAVGAGFTVRKRDNLLAIRQRGIHPSRVDEDPPRYFGALETVTLSYTQDLPARAIVAELARQLGVPYRLHKLARGAAIVHVERVHPRTFLNVFCEAMGFGWGTTRRILVLAQWHRAAHYVVEMGVDNRTE